MQLFAKDLMVSDYDTISHKASVAEAVRLILKGRIRKGGFKTFSVMVIDDFCNLVGVVSMSDVLYHLRPPFLNYGSENIEVFNDEIEPYLEQFRDFTVENIMSTPVVTVSPNDSVMVVIDRMVKKKARRLPVVEDSKLLGIVYQFEIFSWLCENFMADDVPV